MCLWARRDKTNKTNKKKPHRKTGRWDKCQRFEITLLLPRQRQETRCRDAIWREFVSSSSHVQTFPNTSPWIQFLFVWRAVDGGRCVSASSVWGRNLASSRNTNNNPSMFLIRLLFFLLTSAVSRSETIAVTFSVFFLLSFVCFQICSIPRRPGKPTRTHTTPAWSGLLLKSLPPLAQLWLPFWPVSCGRLSGPLLLAPLRLWWLLLHRRQQIFNFNLRSWGSSFKRRSFFRFFFFFFCSFWIVSRHLTGVQNLSSKRRK